VYRAKQFFGALTASIDDDDDQDVARWLTPSQRDLFQYMAPNDKNHSVQVCETLCQIGADDPDLLAAALLHDVGKALGYIWLWQRTLIVLLQRWAPDLLSWLSSGSHLDDAPWWRRGFMINRLHAELGARWAAKAGSSPTAVALIRRHQEPVPTIGCNEDRLLITLQWADGVS
jgi:hypothetical protein